jgi:TonB family protein
MTARTLLVLLFGLMSLQAESPEPYWFATRVSSFEYPPLARLAIIEGKVELQCLLSQDGRIESSKIAVGHPLLGKAAQDAVATWRFRRTSPALSLKAEMVRLFFSFELRGKPSPAKTVFSYEHPDRFVLSSTPAELNAH